MEANLPTVGQTFGGRYRLDAVLGEGGHARVYRATDVSLGREVALKLLKPHDDDDRERLIARFMAEMRAVAKLNNPHIVQMFDFGRTQEGAIFVVFELVPGSDLAALMARGALPEPVAGHILTQLLRALSEAHQLGILHRDLKPANVRIYSYGRDNYRAKLIDFGISKSLDDDASLTATGRVIGTPRYMAPEQLFGEPHTHAVDLYSLGLLGFEMLTGRDPEQMRVLAKAQVVRFQGDDPVSPGMKWFIQKLLERHPEQRFASASDALEAIQHVAAGGAEADFLDTTPSRTRPDLPSVVAPTSQQDTVQPPKRAWGLVLLAAILVGLIATSLGLLVIWATGA